MHRTTRYSILALACLALLGTAAFNMAPPLAQAAPTAPSEQPADREPTVVFIHSRECPICAKVRPIINELETSYKSKAHFVALDVTDEKAKEQSRKIAKSMQIGSFFALYEDTFPCVGIFNDKKKCIKELFGANPKDKYTTILDKAIEQSK
jgi:thiol-disulfide isomerase/thioredoxin